VLPKGCTVMETIRDAATDRAREIRDILRRGVSRQLKGNLDQAQADYERALAADPDNGTAENNLAFVLAQRGRYQEAIGHFERVLAREPDRGTTRSNLAIARAAQGDVAGALSELQTAVEKDPGNALAWDNFGKLLLVTGRPADAEAAWHNALM